MIFVWMRAKIPHCDESKSPQSKTSGSRISPRALKVASAINGMSMKELLDASFQSAKIRPGWRCSSFTAFRAAAAILETQPLFRRRSPVAQDDEEQFYSKALKAFEDIDTRLQAELQEFGKEMERREADASGSGSTSETRSQRLSKLKKDSIELKRMVAETRQMLAIRAPEVLLQQYDKWEANGFFVHGAPGDRESFRDFAAEQEAQAVKDPRSPDAKAWKTAKVVQRQLYELHMSLTRGPKGKRKA
jgi:hypothetical protein